MPALTPASTVSFGETSMPSIQILRLLTAGSVDDGKSTLIGRLLYDARVLPGDTLETLEKPENRLADGSVNLALLTDGLRAEREQGITIDVAHRYFATARRKFIVADTPGHVQYTRNMVTGASNADLAILLVDARHGIQEQTRRHAFVASLLGIRQLVVAVNKIDLVDWSEDVFTSLRCDFEAFVPQLSSIHPGAPAPILHFIPLSALRGDNVVHPSSHLPWYQGPTLLELLETVSVESEAAQEPRFPIQLVIRPQSPEHPDYRGYAGRVASGIFAVGDAVVAHPSGLESRISGIDGMAGPQTESFAGQSVTLLLEDELDLSRGDLLSVVGKGQPLDLEEGRAWIAWMDGKPGRPGGRYLARLGTRTVRVRLEAVESVLDIETLQEIPGGRELRLNDIAKVNLRFASPLPADPYAQNRRTGAFILIDEGSNLTVAAGTLLEATNSVQE